MVKGNDGNIDHVYLDQDTTFADRCKAVARLEGKFFMKKTKDSILHSVLPFPTAGSAIVTKIIPRIMEGQIGET